ncbi:uncharacterized protein LOC132822220 isoform X1 [Hemiscyllium ocellatum]|uniref:uncharacterized protein LOC132822220 isoform X1 n=1 Tax=Hemiscyllium ocellatum TaxID=170820 RepID=UPI00296687C5|nr:uncharacterized protein LOC132822220 isoform X1 [Hemiscyllium ocellatum]XP_060691300.1 uncharacterized protein LOC132822220 isoform X1 [Hemiscyllium ocellatum]
MVSIRDDVSDNSAKESAIYEDPAVKYELKDTVQHQAESILDLDSYLVPFKHLDFSKSEVMSLASESECDLDLEETESVLNGYTPAPTAIYDSPASSVLSLEICHLTPGDTDWEEDHRAKLHSCEELLRCVSSEPSMPALGDSPVFFHVEVSQKENSVIQIPEVVTLEEEMVNSLDNQSIATSVDDVRKRLHSSRGAVVVQHLRATAQTALSAAASIEISRRGLLPNRFKSQKEKKSRKKDQPVILDIYMNKETLHRRHRRKERSSSSSRIKLPPFSKKSRKIASEAGMRVSSLHLEAEHHLHPAGRHRSSISDWIDQELQRREAQKAARMKREAMNEERHRLQELQRIERQHSLPRHESCKQPLTVLQVTEAQSRLPSHHIVQSSPPLRPPSRPAGRPIYPKLLMFPPPAQTTTPLAGAMTIRPATTMASTPRPTLPDDPRQRMFIIVRETYAPPKIPVPTPLEERLLKERFPNYKIPFMKHNPRLVERKIYTPFLDSICIPDK